MAVKRLTNLANMIFLANRDNIQLNRTFNDLILAVDVLEIPGWPEPIFSLTPVTKSTSPVYYNLSTSLHFHITSADIIIGWYVRSLIERIGHRYERWQRRNYN